MTKAHEAHTAPAIPGRRTGAGRPPLSRGALPASLAAALLAFATPLAASAPALAVEPAPASSTVMGATEGETFGTPAGKSGTYQDAAASAGAARGLWSTTSATAQVTITAGTATRLTVRSRADVCDGGAQLRATVDGTALATRTVTSAAWTDLTFPGAWAAGTHTVTVSFLNDFNRPGTCDRNLHLDRITFDAPVTSNASGMDSPGAWTSRQVVGSAPVSDSLGRSWSPATGITGGTDTAAWGDVAGSASRQLYRTSRVGLSSWVVKVPAAARYSVDVMTADSYNTKAGERVFDVLAADGASSPVPLASNVDVVGMAGGWWSYHITGIVPVQSGTLVLTFVAKKGQPLVSGLSVQTYAPLGVTRTTFRDDFDGSAGAAPNAANWTAEVGSGPWGDGELEAYTSSRDNSALDGAGNLKITARRQAFTDANGTRDYTSAKLTTQYKQSFTYGHVETRMKTAAGNGLWPAFWSMGTNKDAVDWPVCGELDIMEIFASQPTKVAGHIHGLGDVQDPLGWRDQRVSNVGGSWDTAAPLAGTWHTYAMDVMPEAVTFSLDGRQYLTVSRADLRPDQQWPVGKPYFMLLNMAVGGTWNGAPDASTPFPASMLVDYVSVLA